jgi:hypothetical protein
LGASGYWKVCVGGRKYFAHVLLCSSFHGARPFAGAVVLHRDDVYEDVVAGDVRLIVEAHGKCVEVLDESSGERVKYGSVVKQGAVCERHVDQAWVGVRAWVARTPASALDARVRW